MITSIGNDTATVSQNLREQRHGFEVYPPFQKANVPVKVIYTGPGGSSTQTLNATIPSIAVHASATVDVPGLSIASTAITKSSTLKVVAGPVPGEKNLTNNSATFTIVPLLT